MAAHTHTHFLKEWSADPSLDATAPYPFNMPQAQDPFTLESHAHHHTQNKYPTLLPTVLQDSTFHRTLRLLANDRAPGPDGIPNALLKILPAPLKTALHNLFKLLWLTGSTPTEWKGSHTIILHKKGDTTHLPNKRPIGLHPSIYKLWTGFVTVVLTDFTEKNHIIGNAQEGFRSSKSTSRQLQRLVHCLEDASLFDRDIYLLYIDLSNAFNTIDHQKLFKIMNDLGFPPDAIAVIRGIYSHNSTQVVINPATGCITDPIPVGRGVIQGDRLSPLIFLIYIEPLLRWLTIGDHGYTPHAQACPTLAR